MGIAFHQLCPRYSGTLTPTASTAISLWETFIFFKKTSYLLSFPLITPKLGLCFTVLPAAFHRIRVDHRFNHIYLTNYIDLSEPLLSLVMYLF